MFGSKWVSEVIADCLGIKKQELQKVPEGSSVTLEDCGRKDATESLAREGNWTDISAVCFIMCTSTAWKLDGCQLQPYWVGETDLRRQQHIFAVTRIFAVLPEFSGAKSDL